MSKIISVPTIIADCCRLFGERQWETSGKYYGEHRNQGNKEKVIRDCCDGKIAEFAVYFAALGKGYNTTAPDMQIYDAQHKSFGPDMVINGSGTQIKTQTAVSAAYYGRSWMFDYNDPLQEDLYVFTVLYPDNQVEIIAAKRPDELVLWEPKKLELRGIKKTYYSKGKTNNG